MTVPTLMVQGTTSDAGKSLLVTALCRWLARQGVRVAPFKPQNMALNSAVTINGGEIGRAQAVQALACGLEPHTDMNPVLLKPNTDTGAQVIIHGRAVANMNAREYHDYKRIARAAVLESFHRLAAQYDAVIVEGAGSPAEINLRENDIANMGFAERVNCPVILVADIDRGGVFAHLVGTLALLSETERQRVIGFVINRFRGDIALLQPGLDWLEARTGKPVLGVLPYLHGLHLEAEDALPLASALSRGGSRAWPAPTKPCSSRWSGTPPRQPATPFPPRRNRPCPRPVGEALSVVAPAIHGSRDISASLRVVVPATPRISNHTDFDPLRLHPQVELSFIGPDEVIPGADLIILPGSKSVRADLAWLRRQGWETAIGRHLRYGGKLIGICGGFQMLGQRIHDPYAIEGEAGSSDGLGLFDLETTLERGKQLANVRGTLALAQAPVSGYEIHAGATAGPALVRPAVHLAHRSDGALSEDGQILGTYLHGLFESPLACAALLAWSGLNDAQTIDYHALRESSIERLADAVAAHLDLRMLTRALRLAALGASA